MVLGAAVDGIHEQQRDEPDMGHLDHVEQLDALGRIYDLATIELGSQVGQTVFGEVDSLIAVTGLPEQPRDVGRRAVDRGIVPASEQPRGPDVAGHRGRPAGIGVRHPQGLQEHVGAAQQLGRRVRIPVDRELYLPRGWCDDPARRAEAGIATSVEFATKPTLGLRMIERAIAAGLLAKWVTADEAYGQDSKFRTWLQQQRIGYVLAVPRNQRVPTTVGNSRLDVLAANAPTLAWKRRSCGDGAKGPRLYD
ncbi:MULTISPECIES: transposase [Micromonospora]|uniref:transposase n=1 Tax=Micromonospora TaxID=1873 RepID=UPI001E5219A7|nr:MULTISPECIES: transposase [Micromonospora]